MTLPSNSRFVFAANSGNRCSSLHPIKDEMAQLLNSIRPFSIFMMKVLTLNWDWNVFICWAVKSCVRLVDNETYCGAVVVSCLEKDDNN